MSHNNIDDGKTIKLKKDVVKNIAIIFLVIMLILTFFSNSIMNKSLPEVAVKYVENGSIAEKIRGTGTVETDDPYSVVVNGTKKISSVAVKVGDDIEKDQVLMYLDEDDSEELEKAEKDLEDLIFKYTTGALTGEMSPEAYRQATSGNVSSMATYESRIEASKARVKAAQELCDSIARQIAIADGSTGFGTEAEINQAKLDLELAQNELSKAKEKYDEVKAIVDAGDGDVESAKAEANLAGLKLAPLKEKYEKNQNSLSEAIKNVSDKVLEQYNQATGNNFVDGEGILSSIFETNKLIKDTDYLHKWYICSAYNDISYDTFTDDFKKYSEALTEYNEKQSIYDIAAGKASAYADANSKLYSYESDYKNAKNKVEEIQTRITSLGNAQAQNTAGNQQLAKDLAIKKADADLELSKAKEDQTQLLLDISKTLDLSNQNSIIKEQQEKVQKLREQAMGSTITAPIAGKILAINKTAGESTVPAEALMTIQVAGKPMTLSFSVTDEQAKKLNIGDEAELQNSWYYGNMRVNLIKIMPDPNEPAKKKKLIFSVDGDVVSGMSLSVSVGQRAREFSKVVPNSAIREDNRGKFVLVIEEKGTPFGTRYKTKRVDVEILATDDNTSAIEGEIDNWAYVVTTSNKPVNVGDQVRLAD